MEHRGGGHRLTSFLFDNTLKPLVAPLAVHTGLTSFLFDNTLKLEVESLLHTVGLTSFLFDNTLKQPAYMGSGGR